jgi:hypothetical protein
MSLLGQSTDYADRDFDSLRLRLQSLVRSVFPDWTDFNVASFGNLLLELYTFVVGDVLAYYQDNRARESRLPTTTQRKNLLALCKLLGFQPAGARAASVDVVFTLAAPPAADVTIPKGTLVRTASVTQALAFQLRSDVVSTAGATPPNQALPYAAVRACRSILPVCFEPLPRGARIHAAERERRALTAGQPAGPAGPTRARAHRLLGQPHFTTALSRLAADTGRSRSCAVWGYVRARR